MARKATKAQIEQRVRAVYELLLSDTPYSDIVRYAANNWGVKSRNTDVYIQRATEMITAESAKLREDALDRHLSQRALLRHKAAKSNDLRLVFEVLRDEGKMLGLYAPEKHKSETVNFDVDLEILTEEQLKRLADGESIAAILADG